MRLVRHVVGSDGFGTFEEGPCDSCSLPLELDAMVWVVEGDPSLRMWCSLGCAVKRFRLVRFRSRIPGEGMAECRR